MGSTLGDDLRRWRMGRGLALTEAARRAKISRSTLQRWEGNEVPPRGSSLARLLDVLTVATTDRTRILAETAPRTAGTELARTPIGSPVHLGQAIRALRVQNSLTQTDLAQKVGVSQAAVAKWEAGTTRPSPETLSRLARLTASGDWLHSLAGEEPVPLANRLDATDWLRTHLPSYEKPNEVALLAFERAIWNRAARDSKWEPLLVETMSWRALAHFYRGDQDAKHCAAETAIRLARTNGAWDAACVAIISRHAQGKRGTVDPVRRERDFAHYIDRLQDPLLRLYILNEWSPAVTRTDPSRSEALALTVIDEAPATSPAGFNDGMSKDDGIVSLMSIRNAAGDYGETMRLYEGMDDLRKGRFARIPTGLAFYLIAAHRIGAKPIPGALEAMEQERQKAVTWIPRRLWASVTRELATPDHS